MKSYIEFINEQNESKISIKDIYNTLKQIFVSDDVLSTDSVYEKTDDGDLLLIISINKLYSPNQIVIYTKLTFHVDKQKTHLVRNSFEYLYTLPNPNSKDNTAYREEQITDINDFKYKLTNIISNNQFGEDIKELSKLIKSPEHSINEWFYKNGIKNISVTGFKFDPEMKTMPSKSLYFEFTITLNEKDEVTLNIRRTNEKTFKLSFDILGERTDLNRSNLNNLEEIIGKTIKDNMK